MKKAFNFQLLLLSDAILIISKYILKTSKFHLAYSGQIYKSTLYNWSCQDNCKLDKHSCVIVNLFLLALYAFYVLMFCHLSHFYSPNMLHSYKCYINHKHSLKPKISHLSYSPSMSFGTSSFLESF